MKNKKIAIVTGGAGFIGTHLVERFLESGNYNITVLDLWESVEIKNWKAKNKYLQFFKQDFNNLSSIVEELIYELNSLKKKELYATINSLNDFLLLL